MHGFFATEQIASGINLANHAHGIGFGFVVHRAIGVFPIAQHAQTDKVFFLTGDLLGSIFAAQLTETAGGHVFTVQFFHHHFNRQPVAIPTGHIRRVKARQRFAADNDVFQNFVYRVSNVNVAVGIGRAIVQNKFGATLGDLAQFLIAFFVLPLLHPSGFAFGKIAAHGKGRFVKINSFGVIGHGVDSALRK